MSSGIFVVGMAMVLAACGGGTGDHDLAGEDLFIEFGCQACHMDRDTDVAPTLRGVWGSTVLLEDGRSVVADEDYVRRSISNPGSDIVAGYDARMPVFDLTVSELERLIDYVRSVG